MNRWLRSAAALMLCAGIATQMRAAILPTDLEAKVGTNYQPVDADERELWEGLGRLDEAIHDSPQRLKAPELEARARRVVERLIGRPAPELRIYFIRDASFNAAMLPSGLMIVNTGLLVRVRNEAQFAAVLGHEAGHYFRKHSLDRYRDERRRSAMMQITAAATQGNADGSNTGTDPWAAINQAIALSAFKFSRDLESEADAYGIMLMARAGYSPRAAAEICAQLIEEREASAAAHGKRHPERADSALSTHPATAHRVTNLADTARHLARDGEQRGGEDADEWAAIIRPYLAMLLHEQVALNDPGASLYLLEQLARGGWTGLLRFEEGEVYRLRQGIGDDARAAAAYAAATALSDAPPEAWRALGYALLKAGNRAGANDALARYLAMQPEAPDAAMIHFALTHGESGAAGDLPTVRPNSAWRRLPGRESWSRWEDVWTRNGSQLDRLTVVGGLPEGKAIRFQSRYADQRVPVFRVGMTAQDLASMLEIAYRVQGVAVFDYELIAPVDFLGGMGVELHYAYASGIVFPKRGRCVMRVVGEKLYAVKLEGIASSRFDAVVPQFHQLVNGKQGDP